MVTVISCNLCNKISVQLGNNSYFHHSMYVILRFPLLVTGYGFFKSIKLYYHTMNSNVLEAQKALTIVFSWPTLSVYKCMHMCAFATCSRRTLPVN